MVEMIESFRGEYWFLSNFYPCSIEVDGLLFPSVEHAYQASKFKDGVMVEMIRRCPTPAEAKEMGKMPGIRHDFHATKVETMGRLLRLKFAPGSDLSDKLLSTGNAKIVEGNHWHDTFWGVCDGEGYNHLGKLLMEVRDDLRRSRDRGIDTDN